MSFAYMRLYTGDYLKDTRHLTPRESGLYLLLLMRCWDHGSVPSDYLSIARLPEIRVGCRKDWAAIRRVIKEFFYQSSPTTMRNKRMDRERRDHWWGFLAPSERKGMQWRRQRRLKNATPEWLTKEQQGAIDQYYEIARKLSRDSGESYQVDHIVPLAGGGVCGLHVPWNLQVLTAVENRKKSNK